MTLIARVLALCALLLSGFGGPAIAADGTTVWNGVYAYDNGQPPVHFTMTLTTKGKTVTGKLEEPATFGDGTSEKLFANIKGTMFGFSVSFKKAYDGTGGQSHTVAYRGTVDGKAMFGKWSVTGLSGTWYAAEAK